MKSSKSGTRKAFFSSPTNQRRFLPCVLPLDEDVIIVAFIQSSRIVPSVLMPLESIDVV